VVGLDMTAHWSPTVSSYLGRVTKDGIIAAVREAVGVEAAERIADKKTDAMAEAAEQLLAGTVWLPAVMRTPASESVPDAETTGVAQRWPQTAPIPSPPNNLELKKIDRALPARGRTIFSTTLR
jgi:hypothetical protein